MLLSAAAPDHGDNSGFNNLLRETYEEPHLAAGAPQTDVQLEQLERVLRFSPAAFARSALNMESADQLSVYVAKQLMTQAAPSLLWITLHDIDVAHSGAYSLYIDGIQRTDRLCTEIWSNIQSNPEYAGKTTMFILPDFGRDSDIDSGGNGFQHHRTGDHVSRTTWMMALGPDVKQNVVVDRSVESTDLIPTLGAYFGFDARFSSGKPVAEVA